MACLVGVDFSAKFMASLAKCFEVYKLQTNNLKWKNQFANVFFICFPFQFLFLLHLLLLLVFYGLRKL